MQAFAAEREIPFTLDVPASTAHGRHVIPLDVHWGEMHLGPVPEVVVVVGDGS